MDLLALNNLHGFKNGDESFEFRGISTGVKQGKEIIDTLYAETHSSNNNKQLEDSKNVEYGSARPEQSGGYIDAGTNPADSKPSSWAY
jgi:hypothetical protein